MREGQFIEPTEEYDSERGVTVLKYPFDIRWPSVGVTSASFGKLAVHERFRHLAQGFLSSAKSLTTELGEHPDRLDWPRASAACFCFYHAVELFVKACILYRRPTAQLICHDVTELKIRYHELYPPDKFFAFQCPWDIRLKDIEKTLGVGPSNDYFDGKSDQKYRYAADKAGDPPTSITVFFPGTWLTMIESFAEDIDRIWSNILETSTTPH